MSQDGPILLFDGECGFCDKTVQWVLDHDPDGDVKFAALQSDVGQTLLEKHGLGRDYFKSLVLIDDGGVWLKSAGALRLAKHLPRPWRWAWTLRLIPAFLRDFGYDIIAKHRLKIFGTVEACRLPTPEQRVRFLA
ncbi:MAG: thiol-disulfide oxidoreductase DCC family protein [Planctomycetota bacterium]